MELHMVSHHWVKTALRPYTMAAEIPAAPLNTERHTTALESEWYYFSEVKDIQDLLVYFWQFLIINEHN